MSIESARAHLARFGREGDVIETSGSSATVELAAAELGVEPARIAKTLAFYGAEEGTSILVVAAGDVRVDNAAFKRTFGLKARMLRTEDVERLTGHAPGGVCPFANPEVASVHLDESLHRFGTLFPAVGNAASAIELSPQEISEVAGAIGWVSVTKVPADRV
ncbi:YbaK/EbsC family protein [Aeromicrobium sp. CF4.19]|uniref:YbaK/EbsC family protein n=1 Tax=Aeromicrobium sp. CF4.19 TaxID=3373082 RepID=UPI003EE5B8BA